MQQIKTVILELHKWFKESELTVLEVEIQQEYDYRSLGCRCGIFFTFLNPSDALLFKLRWNN